MYFSQLTNCISLNCSRLEAVATQKLRFPFAARAAHHEQPFIVSPQKLTLEGPRVVKLLVENYLFLDVERVTT